MGFHQPKNHTEPVVEGDLTIIMLTLNKPPKEWQEFHKKTLLEAIGDRPLIIVSKEPIDWNRPNTQYLYQEEPPIDSDSRLHNIYFQLRRAVDLVKTPYVATVDDDCLYPAEHFNIFRPPLDKFSFNYGRWLINEWVRDVPFYYHAPTPDNPTFIGPTQKLQDSMRGTKFFGRRAIEYYKDFVPFYTVEPVLCFNHLRGLLGKHVISYKKPWPIRAYSILKWGLASEIIKKWQ